MGAIYILFTYVCMYDHNMVVFSQKQLSLQLLQQNWASYTTQKNPHLNYSSPSQLPSFEQAGLTC